MIVSRPAVPLIDAPASVIRATPGHPFYVRGRGWVKAENLLIGDRFRGQHGENIELLDLVDNGVVEPVFNLHVAGAHTYFVGDANSGRSILVHNASASNVGELKGNWTVDQGQRVYVDPNGESYYYPDSQQPGW